MTKNSFARQVLQTIYEAGSIDWIAFGDLIASVSYDENEHPLNKAPRERLLDALALAKFLIESGDFEFGIPEIGPDGKSRFRTISSGFAELKLTAEEYFQRGGIVDIDLISGLWLNKIRADARPSLRNDDVMLELAERLG